NIYDIVNNELTDEDLKQLANHLQRLPKVKYAELIDAQPVLPPFDIFPTTPSFVLQQTYIYANPGVNMQYAWDMGLNGQGIRIKNIEYEFNKNHEEFHVNTKINFVDAYTVNPNLYTPEYSD